MPLEIKPKFPKRSKDVRQRFDHISRETGGFTREKEAKQEENFYESHAQTPNFWQSFVENFKKVFAKPTKESDYVDYQHVAQEQKAEPVQETPKEVSQSFEPSYPKTSWFQAFIDIFKPSKEPNYGDYSMGEEVNASYNTENADLTKVKQDLKDVSKIALSVIKKLPKASVEDFKQTEDFDKFKTILRNNNMIK